MTLELTEDGRTALERYSIYTGGDVGQNVLMVEHIPGVYSGTYNVQLAENLGPGNPPVGSILFNLGLDWWVYEVIVDQLTKEELALAKAFREAGEELDGVYAMRFNASQYNAPWHARGPVLTLTYISGEGLTIYRDGRAPDKEFQFYDYNPLARD